MINYHVTTVSFRDRCLLKVTLGKPKTKETKFNWCLQKRSTNILEYEFVPKVTTEINKLAVDQEMALVEKWELFKVKQQAID